MSREEIKLELDSIESLWGVRQLGKRLGVKEGTIYSHLSRKTDLPPSIKIGSQTRWRSADVEDWIEKKLKQRKRQNFEE